MDDGVPRKEGPSLAEVLAQTQDYVAVLDGAGAVLSVNRLPDGATWEEVQGRPAWVFFLEHEQPRFRDAFQRVQENRQSARLRAENLAGSWLDIRLSPVLRGDTKSEEAPRERSMLVLCVATDVTAERERDEAQRRLELARDASGVGLWHWDVATDHVIWDAATRRIYGYGKDEPLDFAKVLARHPPEDAEKARLHVERALETGVYEKLELRVVGDGATRWILATGDVLRDERGAPKELLGAIVDVTDEYEKRLRADRVSRLEAMGRLAGGIAHDFNNVLAALMGNLQLLETSEDLEEAHELAAEAHLACERAAELVRGITSFSRGHETAKAPVLLSEVVEQALRLFGRVLPATIELHTDLGEVDLTVHANAARLEHVVLNLCLNAQAAVEARSGVIRVAVREATAEERAEDGFGHTPVGVIEVTDTGCGIPASILGQVFEPFFTTRESGSGLGLATSFGIVRDHGGEIRVESEVGRGASFRVLLPLLPEGGTRSSPSRPPPAGEERAAGRILLADDEPALRRVVGRALRKAGFEVTEAANGELAIAAFEREKHQLDAAVIDAVMPRVDGPTVARHIRGSDRPVPIIVMSGYVASAVESIESISDRFLAKPCDPSVLVRALRELIERFRA